MIDRGVTALIPKRLATFPRVGALLPLARLRGLGAWFSILFSEQMSNADVGEVKINLKA